MKSSPSGSCRSRTESPSRRRWSSRSTPCPPSWASATSSASATTRSSSPAGSFPTSPSFPSSGSWDNNSPRPSIPGPIPIAGMSEVQIFTTYVRNIGIGAIFMAGVLGIIRSMPVMVQLLVPGLQTDLQRPEKRGRRRGPDGPGHQDVHDHPRRSWPAPRASSSISSGSRTSNSPSSASSSASFSPSCSPPWPPMPSPSSARTPSPG